jgi:hypothetical protein
MEIIQCFSGNIKIAFDKAPKYPIFYSGICDGECQLYNGSMVRSTAILKDDTFYLTDNNDVNRKIIVGALINVGGKIMTLFRFVSDLSFMKTDAIYIAEKGFKYLTWVKNSNEIYCTIPWDYSLCSYSQDPILTGTKTCIKCGYHNEYIDAVVGYICTGCKMRDEAWR